MTVTLIEAAISEELTQADINTHLLSTIATEPLRDILQQVNTDSLRLHNAIRRQIIRTEMPDPTGTTLFSDTISPINLLSIEDENVQQQNEELDRLPDTQDAEVAASIRQAGDNMRAS
jgi:hypothetical protein